MPRTAGSLLANLEVLARGAAGPAGAALLGARWSFALPRPALRESLTEFSPPGGPAPFFAALEARTGVRVTEGRGGALHGHLASGGAVVVAVDVFHLPYRPAFGRVHSSRTVRVRPGPAPGQVWVDDDWPPVRSGPLDAAVLDRARASPVPRDEVREPLFAGTPVAGEWWAVEVDGEVCAALPARVDALLDELRREAVEGGEDDAGRYGLAAFAAFRAEVDSALTTGPGRTFLRTASLLLRAELGSRVYLCALLAAAARWTGCAALAREAAAYHRTLREMEVARDVLAKSLAGFRPEYAPFVSGCLARAGAAEQRLAETLARRARAGTP
ncbi:MAG TPA: hypothetical protein VFT45_10965 [Longimicrobium sp.]|nr:hypothetical protein [Longimicrobium sp.]